MAEFGTVPFQKIALQRFWRGLVDAATKASAEGAKHVDIRKPACVSDIKMWVNRLIPELQSWNRTHQKITDLDSRIKALRKLPKHVAGCKEEQAKIEMIKRLTSVSLFRLRPFRRTMLWDRYHNSFLPQVYISERVENIEASLPSGEAAFVAFAGGCAAYKSGIVIGDCKEDLRSTYPLIDRTIGLRSNVIVPIRQQAHDSELGAILALIMVSLPFANAFERDFATHLTTAFSHFEDQVELMWEFEQLRETRELDEKDYSAKFSKDEIKQLILDLTPDAYAGNDTNDPARLPGCAILVGEALGGGQMAAAVEMNSAQVAVSPQHEALFAQTELELAAYGLRDRWFTTADLSPISTFGHYSLWYGPRKGRRLELPKSVEAFDVLQIIGDAAALAFTRGGKASLVHRRLDTQRLLFSYTLDYLASGHPARLAAVINEIRAIYAGVKDPIDLDQIDARLQQIRDWVVSQHEALQFLCVSINASVLALEYPAGETYLSGFRATRMTDESRHSLTEKSWPEHTHLTDVAHELSGVRRFIALCRALSALVITSFPTPGLKKFKSKNFGIFSFDSPSKLCAYLPSTLLTYDSILTIERQANAVSIKIENLENDRCLLESHWKLRNSFVPLATSALAPLTPESKPLRLSLSGLPFKDQVLFFDIRRARVGAARLWRVRTNAKCRPVANLVQLLAKERSEWASSMDCLAVVPLPHREGLKQPTFFEWAQGRGERRLLVAGILRNTVEQDVWGDWDIDLVGDTDPRLNEDPFLERFWNLLNGVQRRQSILRQIERLKQSETIVSHLSHDLCSKENIHTLQKTLELQQTILRSHHYYARYRAPIISFTPQELNRHLNQLAEAQVISQDLNRLRVLATLENAFVYRSPTLSELTSCLLSATTSAIRHTSQRLSRTDNTSDLELQLVHLIESNLINKPKLELGLKTPTKNEDNDSTRLLFIHILLDNVLRNAFAAAWSYDGNSKKGIVRVEQRPTDYCLVVANDAKPGRWEDIAGLYKRGDDTLGIITIVKVAERLNIRIGVQVNSLTNGEIQLIVER